MNVSEKLPPPKIPNPIENANYLSIYTFWWLRDIFRMGLKGPLNPDGLYDTKSNLRSEPIANAYEKSWSEEVASRSEPSLFRVMFKHHGRAMLFWGLLFSINETTMRVIQPICLGGLVSYFAPNQTEYTRQDAFVYASGIIGSSAVAIVAFNMFMLYVIEVSATMRIGFMGLIYKKAMSLPKCASYSGLNGQVINMLTADVQRFDLAIAFLHDTWKGPLEVIIFGYFIYQEIGVATIIGMVFLLSFIPLQAYAGKRAAVLRMKTAKRTDHRLKIMNEIILGIQAIKMYAWENAFAVVVDKIRRQEIKGVRGTLYIRATLFSLEMVSRMSVFLSIISYIYFGNYITARKVFIVSSFFNILNKSMVFDWPAALTNVGEGYVSLIRIQKHLLTSETKLTVENTTKDSADSHQNTKLNAFRTKNIVTSKSITVTIAKSQLNECETLLEPVGRKVNPNATKKRVSIRKATAAWIIDADAKNCLEDIDLEIEANQLCVIVGQVGAGKSTLLHVILGELELDSGTLTVDGVVSYAAQDPWLFDGTIRANILFTDPYDCNRYESVIRVCALERDLSLLPDGDRTIIGERGISLSGGQKARINLARAIYKRADIYLLDDPLSAVDAHVGKHIYQECIQRFLNGKICVLVTHQLQYLLNVKNVVLMANGRIEAQGSYDQLTSLRNVSLLSQKNIVSCDDRAEDDFKNVAEVTPKIISNEDDSSESNDQRNDRAEKQAVGSVSGHVYKAYLNAVRSNIYVIVIVISFGLVQFGRSYSDVYTAQWVNWEERAAVADRALSEIRTNTSGAETDVEMLIESEERQQFLVTYSILMVLVAYMFIHRTFAFYSMCLRASINLHEMIFSGVTRASMYFYNHNSSGRILNRFAKDITSVDVVLPTALLDCISCFLEVLAIVVIVLIVNYWLLIPTIVLTVLLFGVRHLYISTSRSLKRIESIRISPVFAHTNESLQGATTIRAMQSQGILQKEFHQHLDFNTEAWFLKSMTNRAFAFWLDVICLLYISTVTLSFMYFNVTGESGNVGLVILQCLNMIFMCQWCIRQTAEVENQMTSVERIKEYVDLPAEPALQSESKYRPANDWPSQGEIIFENLSFRYSENSSFVLKNINLNIRPKEKIGIVGRTGAGKSSIIQAIFRLANLDGVIKIDGIDIQNLGLHDLRSKISIIPQDPVLFSGSLRYNLDPFDTCTDNDLWNALHDVKLHAEISANAAGLNCLISEGGSNLSVGQRQMVCLARAILRRNRILILDEATANVDQDTDRFVQKTIREKFKDCTVLTIAHRLHTVMDSDRLLLVDAGHAVEFDHPHLLLQMADGHLRRLVDQTGTNAAYDLEQEAAKNYQQRNSEK